MGGVYFWNSDLCWAAGEEATEVGHVDAEEADEKPDDEDDREWEDVGVVDCRGEAMVHVEFTRGVMG
jgi:hypothetical protein